MGFAEVKLPGWQNTSIGELVTFHRGVSYKRTDVEEAASSDNIPILRATNIQGSLTLIDPVYVPTRLVKPEQKILENDIVIAMSSGSKSIVGKTAQATKSLHAAHGAFCGVARPKLSGVAGYLGYLFKSKTYRSVVTNSSKGTSINNLKIDHVLGIKFSLPPLEEQERIVDKIDELFSSIEAGERAIEQARAGVARYRKAILKAAVTGELTADWRDQNPTKESAKDLLSRILTARFQAWEKSELAKLDAKGKARPETEKQWEKFRARYKPPVEPKSESPEALPSEWHSASVDALIYRVTKGSSPKWQGFDYQDNGVIFVRSQNVGWGHLELDEVAYLDKGFNTKNPRSMIRDGDILLNIVGASVGRAAIADKRLDGANSNQAVAALRPIEKTSADWILRYFLSPQGQQIIHNEKVDVARANFNLNQIAEVFIPLPPLAEQAEIVNRVEQALSKADAAEATLDAQSRAAKALKQAVLKTAFEGKLVPQNPKDEPASELLKRIKDAS
jgi:type I restriction enzyme S subunit